MKTVSFCHPALALAAFLILQIPSVSVAQAPSAEPCLYMWQTQCFEFLADAENAMRNTDPSHLLLKKQGEDENAIDYALETVPPLPPTSWRATYYWTFQGQSWGPAFPTFDEAYAFAEDKAGHVSIKWPAHIASDNLVLRGETTVSGLIKRVYSHDYPPVPVTYIDITDFTQYRLCTDYTPGTPEAKIAAQFHFGYAPDESVPWTLEPNILAFGFNNCIQPDSSWYRIFGLTNVVVEQAQGPTCNPGFTYDGSMCVGTVTAQIDITDAYYLDQAAQPKECPRTDPTNPCNPSDGGKNETEVDYAPASDGGLSFTRYYNSRGAYRTGNGNGVAWRHTYSRALDEQPDRKPAPKFAAPVGQSQPYTSASDACTLGWGDIKDTVWDGDLAAATATFSEGNICTLSVGGSTAAYFEVRSNKSWSGFVGPTTVKTVTRPNGQSHRFEFNGTDWINELNPSVKLVTSGSDWIFTTTDDTQETYNSAGQLVEIRYRNGQTENLEYNLAAAQGGDDDSSTLDRVTGAFGHTLSFTYDVNGRLDAVTTPDGAINYQYDPDGHLTSATYPDTTSRQYLYEDTSLPGHLTGLIDENNDRYATWAYNTSGRATLSEHAGGKDQVQLTYNADGSTTLTTGNGAVTNYFFSTQQGARRLAMLTGDVCSTCPGGDIADRTYDSNGFLDEVFDWNGNITQTVRNSRGLTETLVEAKGSTEQRTTTTLWDPVFGLPTQITSPKNITDMTYDANGNLETLTVTGGLLTRAWAFTYNASGQPLTIDGPRTDVTDVTTLAYYNCTTGAECGQLQSVTNALSQVTTYDTYDASGRLTQMTDPNGLATSFSYDTRGNLLTVTQTPVSGTPRVTTMTYDGANQLETMATPDGLLLTYTYDATHYLRSVTDNFGNRIDYDYDAMGNLKEEDTFDPSSILKRALDYAYDLNDRLDTVTNGGFVTDLTIDLVGNLTNEVDPKLASTQHVYDALNRLDQTIDALTGVIDYGYDAHDNITSVAAANGATTTYEYDDLDNLTKEISPDRGTIIYTYDDAGNRATELDARSKLTTYAYDALNRLTLVTLDAGGTIGYEYDIGTNAIGRLNKITDASGLTTWTYDNFGAVTQKTQTIGSVALSTGYTYDAGGKLLSMTLPSGKVITYGYDILLPNSVTVDGQTVLSGATYDPFGPVNAWTWGNGSFASRNFSLRGLLDSQTLAGDTRALGYDAAGQVTSILDTSLDVTFNYDLLGRITDFTNNNGGGGGGGSPAGPMFSSPPVILANIQSDANESAGPPNYNRTPWITAAVQDVTAVGMEVALERSEVATGSITVPETIGYVAITGPSSGSFPANGETILYEAQTTAKNIKGFNNGCYETNFLNSYSSQPGMIATKNTHTDGNGGWIRKCNFLWVLMSVGLTVDEDTYNDSERRHNKEAAGLAVFSQPFDTLISDDVDTWRIEYSVVYTLATVAGGHTPVTFRQPFGEVPVVVAFVVNNGILQDDPTPVAVRIRNVTTTGFEAIQAEPANNDAAHDGVSLFYLAVESGTHELPDGTRILADFVSTTSQQHGVGVSGSESWETVTFADWPGASGGSSGPLPDSQVFAYDSNGNRSSLTENGTPYSYTNLLNSNRLLSTAGPTARTYIYDAAGNVSSDGVHSYAYDDRGRLVDVDSGAATYQHNGQGQRVKKDMGGNQTLFVYDEAGGLIGEYDGDGNAIRETAWFGGAPVAVLQGPDQYYVHTDQLGTPRVITDGSTIIWRWQSDPFGSTAVDEDPDGDATLFTYNLRFPGQYYDAESGLHYNYFRTYDPSTGKYYESDPIGLVGGPNTYGYASMNPLAYYDPYGLFCLSGLTRDLIIAGLSGAVGGAIQGGIVGGTSSGGLAAIPGAIVGGLIGLSAGIAGEYIGSTVLGGVAVGAVSGAVGAGVTREGIGGVVGGAVGGAISGAPGGGIGAAVGGAVDAGKGLGKRLAGAVSSGKIGLIGGISTDITSRALSILIPDCDEKITYGEDCEQS